MPFNSQKHMTKIMQEARTATIVKKDFFGRVIQVVPLTELERDAAGKKAKREERKVWITYNEGLNNAVKKPMSLQDFLSGI